MTAWILAHPLTVGGVAWLLTVGAVLTVWGCCKPRVDESDDYNGEVHFV